MKTISIENMKVYGSTTSEDYLVKVENKSYYLKLEEYTSNEGFVFEHHIVVFVEIDGSTVFDLTDRYEWYEFSSVDLNVSKQTKKDLLKSIEVFEKGLEKKVKTFLDDAQMYKAYMDLSQ